MPETRYRRDEQPQQDPPEVAENEKSSVAHAEIIHPLSNSGHELEYLGKGKPSRQQFNLIQPMDRKAVSELFRHVVTPIQIFFYPIVCWAAWTMAGAANAFLLLNLFQSPALSGPPYNFSSASIGFANFAPAVGAIVGLAIAGPFSDWIAMRATKRNRGIREPEMRLPALIPFLAISLIAMVVSQAFRNTTQRVRC